MNVLVLSENGYEEAALGFSLSYNSTPERAKQIFQKYAFGVPGESKFLESMYVWIDVTAPRFWWQEADTYRVGNSKQSQSTMHTITKRKLEQSDFYSVIAQQHLDRLNDLIWMYSTETDPQDKYEMFVRIKSELPEGFLQRRIWCVNYKTLQNMYWQRKKHRLKLWQDFFTQLRTQIQHPDFIFGDTNE